ncbi:MAG: hypothetical protein LH609_22040 [Rudanella sp.]|nr:hypothetical protein [Rudanella sp.]
MIALHEGLRDRALRLLRLILETKEANGQETQFARAFIINKAMIEWLNGLKADDE